MPVHVPTVVLVAALSIATIADIHSRTVPRQLTFGSMLGGLP